ncbi:hypothetical protein NKR23_g4304 [Pleurostoma richardsiae]|uniref:Fungal N-terminal domain-containing protein n=1 Tax=Pleurostoma richardsiae TaxID=41990 RepID=A0AA38RVV1_9PEZI|nr:hypothetical protein NKR23_g4304 [Pleurostoma richardsiae]
MADPLSIAASITGLVAAARKIYTVLSGFTASVSNAPEIVQATLAEVVQMKSALIEVQQLMDAVETLPPDRKALIRLDHITITFSQCTIILTELESVVCDRFVTDARLTSRLRWALGESEKKIARLLPRLESQRSCLTLMMSILRCRSDLEALRDRDRLQETLENVLGQNVDLTTRLEKLETVLNDEERLVRLTGTESVMSRKTITTGSTTVLDTPNRENSSQQTPRSPLDSRDFEVLLEASWVYRRVRSDECDKSISSYTMQSSGWSVLSTLSLNDISIVSVFRIPVTVDDISKRGLGLAFGSLLSGRELPTPWLRSTTDPSIGTEEIESAAGDKSLSSFGDAGLVDFELADTKVVVVRDSTTYESPLIHRYVARKPYKAQLPPTVQNNYVLTVVFNDER